jgi:hypothetical protein
MLGRYAQTMLQNCRESVNDLRGQDLMRDSGEMLFKVIIPAVLFAILWRAFVIQGCGVLIDSRDSSSSSYLALLNPDASRLPALAARSIKTRPEVRIS